MQTKFAEERERIIGSALSGADVLSSLPEISAADGEMIRTVFIAAAARVLFDRGEHGVHVDLFYEDRAVARIFTTALFKRLENSYRQEHREQQRIAREEALARKRQQPVFA